MGTGGILSKKSWHVGNKQNRARVLRDEQAARADALERQEREAAWAKERLRSQLRSGDGDGGQSGQGTGCVKRVREEHGERFDPSFRLGGAVGAVGGSGAVPWYLRGKVDRGDERDSKRGDGGRREDDKDDKECGVGEKSGTTKRPALLGAVVVGKAKKMSKKDRRRVEKEKLLALRAERERREKIERERMRAVLQSSMK